MRKFSLFFILSGLVLNACMGNEEELDNSQSSIQHASDSRSIDSDISVNNELLSKDANANVCTFVELSNEELNKKFGAEYIEFAQSEYVHCKKLESSSCAFAYTLTDMSFKEDFPYPKWDDYSHSAGESDETGKGETDAYTEAVKVVIAHRNKVVEKLSDCAREQCKSLGGKDLGFDSIGVFFCEMPTFESAMKIASRHDVASFESPQFVSDP